MTTGKLSNNNRKVYLTCSCHKGTRKNCKYVVNQDWLVFQCEAATASACDNKKCNIF